jgi:predicted DNA-binding transcriptional regulator AlpA
MTDPKEKLLIDINELSALIGISVGTLYHWVSQRRIPCLKLSQRCLRFSLPVIRDWVANLNQPCAEADPKNQGTQPPRSRYELTDDPSRCIRERTKSKELAAMDRSEDEHRNRKNEGRQ